MTEQHIEKISEVLLGAQRCVCFRKLIMVLRNVYKKLPFDVFLKEFLRCLKHFLFSKTLAKQNYFVDNGLEFCALFSTSFQSTEDDSTAIFLESIFKAVLKLSNVGQARYRVCYFINRLLQRLEEGAGDLDENICDNIRDAMLERIRDTKPAVQIQAIEVLQKLQDPYDNDDIVVKAFINSCCDPSAQVRKAVIRCMGITGCTIHALLRRCRDVDYSVRCATYDRLSKLNIRMVKIEHRQYLLSLGLNDVHKKVLKHVKEVLISNWLSNCNGDYFELVKSLRLDADEKDWTRTGEIVEQTLKAIFKDGVLADLMETLPLGPNRVITFVGKNWEQIIYWRCLIAYIKSEKTLEEFVDRIMPDLSIFCVYIRSVHHSRTGCKLPHDILENHQIMKELLSMLMLFDFSDEVGRKNVHLLITDMLVDTSQPVKNLILIVEILEQLIPNLDDRFTEIGEIIYRIRNPLMVRSPPKCLTRQRDVKVAEIRVKLNIATYDQEQAIAKADFQQAEILKHVINDLNVQMKRIQDEFAEIHAPIRVTRNDIHTLCQCLDLLTVAIHSTKVKKIPAVVFKLHSEFVEPLTVSPDPEICNRVLKFYALLGIMDKAIATKTLHLFTNRIASYKAIPSTNEESIILSIYAVTDLLLTYGSDLLCKEPENKRSHKRVLFNDSLIDETADFTLPSRSTLSGIVDMLSSMVDDTVMEIREKACQSLLKLLYKGVVNSVMLLSKFVLKWFNPVTAKDSRVIQLLGKFFTEYTSVPRSASLMWKLFVPTLTALVDAPKYSPLADVETLTVIKFLIELCRPNRHTVAAGVEPYKSISLTLCREILERPNNKVTLAYMQVLVLISPPFDDLTIMNDLRDQVDLMATMIKDKKVLKYLQRYKNKLDGNTNEGVTDPSAEVTLKGSNETYLSLPDSDIEHYRKIPDGATNKEDDDDDDDDDDNNDDTVDDDDEVEDATLEDELPENAANTSTLHNVPTISTDVNEPAVVESTTKAMKRRKKRGRDKRKQLDLVGDSTKALSNIHLRDDNDDEKHGAQVIIVQTDSDTEQPQCKTHVPEARVKNPNQKSKDKTKRAVADMTRARSRRKSKTESDVVLQSADSTQEQPTTSKHIVTRGKKGGRKLNTDSQIADKNQPTEELTGKRGKKGGRNANIESEAKMHSADSESEQAADQMKKTQNKKVESKSNKEPPKVLEAAVDSKPEGNDTQTSSPPRRRSRRKRTPRKWDDYKL
ncbi:Chromosome associated protein G [Carabus blaptoides fortunei]